MSLQALPKPDPSPTESWLPVNVMTHLPLPSSTARAPRRWRATCLLGGLLATAALMAQAAVTHGSSVEAAPTSMGAGTRTLDKALNGDLSTGDRNLDLLLESQRKGGARLDEAPAAQAMPAQPAGSRLPLQPLLAAVPAVQAPRPSDAGPRFEPLLTLPERGQMGSAGLPAPRVARDWSGGSTQTQTAAGAAHSGGSIYGDSPGLKSAARPMRDWLQEGVAFVKDNLITVLLVVGVIALLAIGLKAYSRRI